MVDNQPISADARLRPAGTPVTAGQGKPLRHWTKAELDEALATAAADSGYSVEEIAAEADRRVRVKSERQYSKPLTSMTDGELRYEIKVSDADTTYNNGLRLELERRGTIAQARSMRNVGVASMLIAIAAAVVAVLND